jgi:hypothetical protein
MRISLAALGVALSGYGVWLLSTREDHLVDVASWLVGGVALHDLVLAPVVVLIVAIGQRVLPSYARGPAVAGLVVLGSATAFAIPVLGRFGARPDNPTLLDRDYTAGWLVLAGLTATGVVAASLVVRSRQPGRKRERGGADGPGARRRRRPHGA